MKRNNIIKGFASVVLAGGLMACSSDYLEQPPIDTVADSVLGESVEAARAALYGACEAMYIGTYSDAIRMPNGEAYLQTYYGDSASPDCAYPWLYGYQAEYQAWPLMRQDSYPACRYPWMYCYNLINQANVILKYIDNVPGDTEEVDLVKAQALTLRAHAYTRLMQIYAPRYEDSNNGSELCVVLRLTPGTENLPLSTYKEVVDQIYEDLDSAIELYNGTSAARSNGFEPDLQVAQGIYSRIALLNHDWAKAQQMAHDARQGHAIMSAAEYKAGFADANDEWLWYNDFNKEYNGYNSWGASFSANGAYAANYEWSTPGVISYKFYKEMYDKHPDDIRCDLYFTPDKGNKYANLGLTDADFWNTDNMVESRLTLYGTAEKMSAAASLFVRNNTPAGFSDGLGVDVTLTNEDASNKVKRSKWFSNTSTVKGVNRVAFGAQLKFWSYAEQLGDAQHPFMRAAELLFTEAEAALEQGDEATAKACLVELNSKRIEGYSCDLSGDALKEELRLYRRFELWGEGDTWFSMKRWNISVQKEVFVANDPTSNNFLEYYEGSYDASFGNGWRYSIPRSETNYNTLINSQLNSATGTESQE